MSKEVFISGHSLGAARACLYAWSRIKRGLHVDGVYVFGCPNPGNHFLQNAVRYAQTWRSIKNGHDLVPDVPVEFPLLGIEYVQMKPFEETNEPPHKGDTWGPFSWHHIELYQAGVAKLPPTGNNVHIELNDAVNSCADLYANTGNWDMVHSVNGQYFGTRTINGAKLIVFRGSTTSLDWMNDLEATQVTAYDSKVSVGFWNGVNPIATYIDSLLT